MTDRYLTDQQRVLADLARADSETHKETAVLVSPGASAGPWTVRVTGHVAYNVYDVEFVIVGESGTIPTEVGQETEAVNLAESFISAGTLASGTYALMFHMGQTNVFYATP